MTLAPLGKHFPTANAALGESNLPQAILWLLWVTAPCSASSQAEILPLCFLSRAEACDTHPPTAFVRGENRLGFNGSNLNFEQRQKNRLGLSNLNFEQW